MWLKVNFHKSEEKKRRLRFYAKQNNVIAVTVQENYKTPFCAQIFITLGNPWIPNTGHPIQSALSGSNLFKFAPKCYGSGYSQ